MIESIKLVDHHFSASDFQPRIFQQIGAQELDFAQNWLFSKSEIDVVMQGIDIDLQTFNAFCNFILIYAIGSFTFLYLHGYEVSSWVNQPAQVHL